MDLLCNAYSNSSSSDDDDAAAIEDAKTPTSETFTLPPSKRFKPQNPISRPQSNTLLLHRDTPLPGRYVSKRERALLKLPDPIPNSDPTPTSSGIGFFFLQKNK